MSAHTAFACSIDSELFRCFDGSDGSVTWDAREEGSLLVAVLELWQVV